MLETTFSHVKNGRRADLGNIYLRSRWEANYCRWLNFLIRYEDEIIKWEYEKQTFYFDKIKRGTTSYTPDFKVYFKDGHIEYHEVKGWDYPRGVTARKRMAKYFPEIKLLVFDESFFKDIKRKHIDKVIPNWE
jgi:hypothetical protein